MDSTRQSKISRLLQKELANYFLLNSQNYTGAMISVSEVRSEGFCINFSERKTRRNFPEDRRRYKRNPF